MDEGTLDAFTSGTIPGQWHNRPAFPFKYYISKVRKVKIPKIVATFIPK
jgi:hypothetical protein